MHTSIARALNSTSPSNSQEASFKNESGKLLLRIPYGETRSYGDLAKELGNIKAVRAVASANGANSMSLIVPCHRIIESNGNLGGYAGGLPVKRKLLDLESNAAEQMPLF